MTQFPVPPRPMRRFPRYLQCILMAKGVHVYGRSFSGIV